MYSHLISPSAYPTRCAPLPCKLRLPRWASPPLLGNSHRSCNSRNNHSSSRSSHSLPHPSHPPPAPLASQVKPADASIPSALHPQSLWTLRMLQRHRRRLMPRQRCRPSRRHQGLRPVSVCRCTRRCCWLRSGLALQTRNCRFVTNWLCLVTLTLLCALGLTNSIAMQGSA